MQSAASNSLLCLYRRLGVEELGGEEKKRGTRSWNQWGGFVLAKRGLGRKE
jgi:hypothetical protein